jgi:hypothetical protein
MGVAVVQEFPQTVSNTTVMGEELYSLIKGKNLVAYSDADMRVHVTNATGVETARGFRIAKEKASKKVDLAVALAMAVCAALQAGKPLTNPHAVPLGVGNRGIGSEIRRTFGSSISQPMLDSTFGPAPIEERPGKGCAALFRFYWGEDNSEDPEPGAYISQTGRRRNFPSID